MENNKKGNVFIIAAPSGTGKTSVITQVIKRLNDQDIDISRVITYTTRNPRENETNGKDYFFLSVEDFGQKAKDNFFLETTVYRDKLYGSPNSFITDLQLGKSFVIITDIEGVKNYSKLIENPMKIWIQPPSLKELKNRLVGRKSCSQTQIDLDLARAQEEIKEAEKPRFFNYTVVNDIFDQTVAELIKLITETIKQP